ncbi:hypothetical protein [Actinacidiphila yeochonensis]|uniref:hypothetical protein n=1 Tax=Actinacidiphila yeochonensis TaxID=89050 RepID=UPI0005645B8F|nr:hypothetical protein [Actinacidiphila yeochonensis]
MTTSPPLPAVRVAREAGVATGGRRPPSPAALRRPAPVRACLASPEGLFRGEDTAGHFAGRRVAMPAAAVAEG